jgi:pyruvate,water dikinase
MRRLYGEMGRRLVARRIIETEEDVYFLDMLEIAKALAEEHPYPRRYVVAARRASFTRSAKVRPPNRFRDQTPLDDREDAAPAEGNQLRGMGASPGVASGLVRVVDGPDQVGAFQAGEILVTASPNPAWTPVYAVASALVTGTGSILSHGLVSAREYHLPSVIGIADVTKKLSTGQKVTVDGDKGIVSF